MKGTTQMTGRLGSRATRGWLQTSHSAASIKRTVDGENPVELCNYTDVFYNRRIRPGMDFMIATASCIRMSAMGPEKRATYSLPRTLRHLEEIGIPSYVTEDISPTSCVDITWVWHVPGWMLTLDGVYLSETLRSPASGRQFAKDCERCNPFWIDVGSYATYSPDLPTSPGRTTRHRRRAGLHRRGHRAHRGSHRRHRTPARLPAPRAAHPRRPRLALGVEGSPGHRDDACLLGGSAAGGCGGGGYLEAQIPQGTKYWSGRIPVH